MKVKFFTQPVVIRNSEENRSALESVGYKADKGNHIDHVNIVTGDSSYYTVGCDQESLENFSFPVWNGTIDCRNDNKAGLAYAACFELIDIQTNKI